LDPSSIGAGGALSRRCVVCVQQMPVEGRKFKAVDTTWRRTMEKVGKNPEAMVVASDEELLKNLTEANKLLDAVQKGLSDYLETKRLAFPR
jgi:dynein heavy chain